MSSLDLTRLVEQIEAIKVGPGTKQEKIQAMQRVSCAAYYIYIVAAIIGSTRHLPQAIRVREVTDSLDKYLEFLALMRIPGVSDTPENFALLRPLFQNSLRDTMDMIKR